MQGLGLVVAVARKSPLPGDGSQRRSSSGAPLLPEDVPGGHATCVVLDRTEYQSYGHGFRDGLVEHFGQREYIAEATCNSRKIHLIHLKINPRARLSLSPENLPSIPRKTLIDHHLLRPRLEPHSVLFVNLMANNLRTSHRLPPMLLRKHDLPRLDRLEAHIQEDAWSRSRSHEVVEDLESGLLRL
jgi:hypothetical protein